MGILSSLFGIGGTGKQATSTQIIQSQIPQELSPFVKQILSEAQALYGADIARGYDPYTGLTTAPFTAEQLQAQEDIKGLRGTQAPFIQEALGIQREGAEKFTDEVAKEYMSPYQRAVTDIEKREAQTRFEKDVMPKFEASAVEAGGLSGLGSRAGVEAAELQRGQSQLLADIEAKGLQSSFLNAQQQFAQQKQREQQMAANIGRAGPALFGATLAEAGAAEGVGAERRGLVQSALDEAYFKFLEEQQFPQRTLAQYQGSVYGNPMLGTPSQTKTTTGTPYQPSMGQNLLGMGLTGLNIYGLGGGSMMGGTGFTGGNLMQNIYGGGKKMAGYAKGGGSVGMSDKNLGKYMEQGSGAISASNRDRLMRLYKSGLSGLPVVRRQAGTYGRADSSGAININRPRARLGFPSLSGDIEDITLDDISRISMPVEGAYDREKLEPIYEKARKASGKETGRYDAAMKALVDPFLEAQRERIGRGVTPQKAAAIQALIGQIATSPSGALGGLLDPEKGVARTLEKLGEIDTAQAERESEFATTEFGIKEKDLTTKHQRTLGVIKSNKELELIFNELPEKRKKAFLNNFKTVSGAYANVLNARAALLKARNAANKKGELKATVNKQLDNLVLHGLEFSSKTDKKGDIQILGTTGQFLKPADSATLARTTAKMLKAFGKYKEKMSDPHALAAAFTEVFPEEPLPEDISNAISEEHPSETEIPSNVLESKTVDENISIIE